MRTPRRPRRAATSCRALLAAAGALVALAACGGGGSSTASGTSSSAPTTTSSSAATTTPAGPTGADAVFCNQVSQLVGQLAGVQSAPAEQAPALLQQLVTNFDGVQPPDALKADWQALGNGLHQLQSALGSVDLTTPEGQAKLKQLEQQTTAAAAGPQGNISAWVLSNCTSGGPTASTSAASTS